MKQGFLVALLTAAVFAAGFFSGRWMESHSPLPPPPGGFGSEFFRRPPGSKGTRHERPINRAELVSQIESLRPQIEAFQSRIDQINGEFDRNLQEVLTPEQRSHHSDWTKGHSNYKGPKKDKTKPLTDDEISYLEWEQPERTLLREIMIPMSLDLQTRIYKLDDDQRDKVRALLKTRRQEMLDLVDSSPPPTVMLSRLAPIVQRLAEPSAPPPAPQDPK